MPKVSIRTRPEERVIRSVRWRNNILIKVSIRTRPEERVIHAGYKIAVYDGEFQSAPAPKSG